MRGEKRKSSASSSASQSDFSRASLQEENRSLNNAAKKCRAWRAEGLADCETRYLLNDQSSFTKSLRSAGYFVKESDKENILVEDQAIFSKKLKYDVAKHFDHPNNIRKMLDTFLPWLDDETFLIKCLRPTKTSAECSTARSSMQVKYQMIKLSTVVQSNKM